MKDEEDGGRHDDTFLDCQAAFEVVARVWHQVNIAEGRPRLALMTVGRVHFGLSTSSARRIIQRAEGWARAKLRAIQAGGCSTHGRQPTRPEEIVR